MPECNLCKRGQRHICAFTLGGARPPPAAALSVWMSKVQRSSTSLVATLVTTSTIFCSCPSISQSGSDAGPNSAACLIHLEKQLLETHFVKQESTLPGSLRRLCQGVEHLGSGEETRKGRRARHLLQHATEVLLDARVGGHHHAEPVVFLLIEAVRWVHAALVQYAARRQLRPSRVTSILIYT